MCLLSEPIKVVKFVDLLRTCFLNIYQAFVVATDAFNYLFVL